MDWSWDCANKLEPPEPPHELRLVGAGLQSGSGLGRLIAQTLAGRQQGELTVENVTVPDPVLPP